MMRRERVVRVSDGAGVPQPGNRRTARERCPGGDRLQRVSDAHRSTFRPIKAKSYCDR